MAAFVTGASRGFGRGVAKVLATEAFFLFFFSSSSLLLYRLTKAFC